MILPVICWTEHFLYVSECTSSYALLSMVSEKKETFSLLRMVFVYHLSYVSIINYGIFTVKDI